jgi:hypothetical protein
MIFYHTPDVELIGKIILTAKKRNPHKTGTGDRKEKLL